MDEADDPDPDGPVHPSVFYGLWPRFTVDEDAGPSADATLALLVAD